MKNNYLCPMCRGYLNVADKLVFSIKGKKSPKRGLVFLSSEIGDYDIIKHPYFDLDEGDITDIHCPICHVNLKCHRNPNFARIIMVDQDLIEFELVFSRIVGEKCSFKVNKGEVVRFGQHAERYNDFFKSFNTNIPFSKL